ncbi:hypothetical protein [Marinobacter salarius]|uniref:Uncharacterized protein n=1 Tax=Marinobacter salarius TaxID=1420917 RepID=W5YUW7_9GAMM|nr:hypothetical protein [Marinobacter salarius]AHI32871.1 hypothetical protein AU15_21785 [Marinobacter salarius]AZR43484.1 hypothetical protein MTMN5_04059 [Marinobacter salarius]
MDTLNHPASQAKVRCFGSKAGLTAEATVLLKDGAEPLAALNLEVAPRDGERINWKSKIVLQLGEDDLPLLCCVCLGYLPQAEFKRPTKGISIQRQPGKLFISASQGADKCFALPLPIPQSFQLGALALKQLKQQAGFEDEQLILAALRGAAALYQP